MTTNQGLILRRRSGAYIDLTTAPYSIGRNFAIPSLAGVASLAVGSSANVYAGGERVSIKYSDRLWMFEIRILSSTVASVQLAARRITDFLLDINEQDPMTIEYRTNTDTPEPLWGQYGVSLKFEVVHADVNVDPTYADNLLRAQVAFVSIAATIKPAARTQQQLVCTATGGIVEDMIGAPGGRSRGTIIPEATTNKMTNPVFGSATWNTGWTTGAQMTSTRNTDPAWLIPGTLVSAKLSSISAAFNEIFTQSINAGNTNKHSLSCLARLQDGGVISATQLQLYYDAGALTTTYTSLGSGWYWVRAENFDGVNAARDTGVILNLKQQAYVTAFQLEEKAYSTYPCFGDMNGCAWTGTAHASTSTRTGSTCKLPVTADILNPVQGSVRVVVRFDVASTFVNTCHILDTQDGSHASAQLYYQASDDKFYFNVGAVFSLSAAKTFAAGSIFVLHATWSGSTQALYINGALEDSDNTVMTPFGANLFLGTNYIGGNPFIGAFLGAAIFDRTLTASEILNDYNDLAPVIARGDRVEAIPWLWSDDGDGILGLATGKTPRAVAAGVDGSLPAITEIFGTLSSAWSTIKAIALSNFPANFPVPWSNLFIDSSGTAEGGAGDDYGAAHKVTTVTGAADIIGDSITIKPWYISNFIGLSYSLYARIKGSGAATLSLYPVNASGDGEGRLITIGTSWRLYHTRLHILDVPDRFVNVSPYQYIIQLKALLATGTVDVSVDYLALLPRSIVTLENSTSSYSAFSYRGDRCYSIDSSKSATFSNTPIVISVTGNPIEFEPNKYNVLQVYTGVNEAIDPLITYTVTISSVYVTPRWALL